MVSGAKPGWREKKSAGIGFEEAGPMTDLSSSGALETLEKPQKSYGFRQSHKRSRNRERPIEPFCHAELGILVCCDLEKAF